MSVATACGAASHTQKPPTSPEEDPSTRDPVLESVLQEHAMRRASKHAPDAHADSKTSRANAGTHVHGITGSLTGFEVDQAMNTRHDALLACVSARPRALGHVAGSIAFHVTVDGGGKVERVRITESDLGYAPLESCLASVVVTAPFPVPAGAERAETQWRMSVDPLQRPAEWVDATDLKPMIERYAEVTYEQCDIDTSARFVVNGYLTRGKKLQPLTVRAPWGDVTQASEEEQMKQLSCLSNALQEWKGWPKVQWVGKTSFELQWIAAPSKRKGRANTPLAQGGARRTKRRR